MVGVGVQCEIYCSVPGLGVGVGVQCEIYYGVPQFMLTLNQSDMTCSEEFLCLFFLNFVVGAFGSFRDKIVLS